MKYHMILIGMICLAAMTVGRTQHLVAQETPPAAAPAPAPDVQPSPPATPPAATPAAPPDVAQTPPPAPETPPAPAPADQPAAAQSQPAQAQSAQPGAAPTAGAAAGVPKITPPEQGLAFPAAMQVLAYNAYAQLAATHGDANFCFSPQLLAKQLTALRFGADGKTAAEMCDVFPFKTAVPQTAEMLRQVDASSAQVRKGVQVPQLPPTFGQASAVWVPADHPIVEQYITGVKSGLSTELYAADFKTKRDAAATTVNAWVRDMTGGRLTSIIAEPFEVSLPNDISVLATGVACASPRLAAPFNRQFSGNNEFVLASGEKITVPMMRQIGSCFGTEVPNLQVLVIPCVEENLRVVVLLPAAGQLGTLEKSMTPEFLTQLFGKLQPMVVDVVMPKVQATACLDLVEPLKNLGLQTAATENADLSNMSQAKEKGPLRLSKFLHETQMTLVEQADIPQQQVPQANARFYVNRPYVYLVWNAQTMTPLVIGRVTDPR